MERKLQLLMKRLKIHSLRSFLAFVCTLIAAVSLLSMGALLYGRISQILTENYQESITRQLTQVNTKVEDKINTIDSLFPLIMSNAPIREALEPVLNPDQEALSPESQKLLLEKELSYSLISNYLWSEKFISSVSIFDSADNFYSVSLHKQKNKEYQNLQALLLQFPADATALEIRTLPDDTQSIYFLRNIFSTYTGERIAVIIIDINRESWENFYMEGLDEHWNVCLLDQKLQILSSNSSLFEEEPSLTAYLSQNQGRDLSTERTLNSVSYYLASRPMNHNTITSVVMVPKNYLLSDLTATLRAFLWLFLALLFVTLFFAFWISRAVSYPIGQMLACVRHIAKGNPIKQLPTGMYDEFNELAEAFSHLLRQLDTYYTELYEKQLLLKNAKIKSLQSQMDPHFLFNVLDTIAWKAAMTDQEDIYQMTLALGEMLRANILAQEKDFVTMEEELSYIKFYIQLQQMRFEDKFTVDILVDPALYGCQIPRFCLQPLVENAIVHGLEPKKDTGKLCINVIDQQDFLELAVIDNGVGFSESLEISSIESSAEDSHTHIGLKNLDKRLSLLYGPDCRLHIKSIPDYYTAVSFQIPKATEVQ